MTDNNRDIDAYHVAAVARQKIYYVSRDIFFPKNCFIGVPCCV